MKIGIIASLYAPYTRGGAEVFVGNIVGELKKNHDLFVVTAGEWHGVRSLLPKLDIIDGVRVYRFYPANIFSFIHINEKPFLARVLWSIVDLFNIHSILIVRSILRKEKAGLVMVHTLKGLSYCVAALLNAMRIRWIYTPHDVQLVIPSGRLYAPAEKHLASIPARMCSWVMRLIIGSPTLVVTSSAFLLDFYSSRGFFPRSVRRALPSPAPNFPSTEESHNQKHFLYLGQLERYKGVDVLIEAFRALNDPSLRLCIVGTGSLENEIRRAIQEDPRISYRGYVGGEEKARLIAECGYTIVSSRVYENSPSVVYESFALGTPVIVTVIGGASELVKDGVNGFWVETFAASELSRAILRAAETPAYDTLSHNAKESVAHLTLERYCTSILSLVGKDGDGVCNRV